MSYYASYFPSGVPGSTFNSVPGVPINSFDALVPQDMNGTEDVYEWEREGIGRGFF
jgi:hypothetical protein